MQGRITVSKPNSRKNKLLSYLHDVRIKFLKELDVVNLNYMKIHDGFMIRGKALKDSIPYRLFFWITANDNGYLIKYDTDIPSKIRKNVVEIVKNDLIQVGR
jgi:hypothetical protein